MENFNDDDIDVISNGDHQNSTETLIDIRSAPRQQLYFSNAGNTDDNAGSLHSLKLSYDALKRRYNELEIKTQTMQKVIAEMETERLGKEHINQRVSIVGCDAAGPAASASPDAGTSEGSTANVRAHLGYAQRLERQNVRLQLSMEEQTQKYRKAIEQKHSENEQLKSLLIQKDEEIKRLKGKTLETRGNTDFSNTQVLQKEIRELREENLKLNKEVRSQEDHIQALVQRNQMGQQKLSPSMSTNYGENESILLLDNGKILEKIREQNKIIQTLQQQVTEQRQMIEDQTFVVKKVISTARASGVSLSSSMDISRRIEGSSIHGTFNEQSTSNPRSPRSPKSSLSRLRDSGIGYPTENSGTGYPTENSSQFNPPPNNPKITNASTGIFRDTPGQYFQPDYHDGYHRNTQLSPVSRVTPQTGLSNISVLKTQEGQGRIPDLTGARPKIGSSPGNLNFSPLVDDLSLNPSQQNENNRILGARKSSDLNVSYVPLQTIGEGNSQQTTRTVDKVYAPNFLRQGEISRKQPQQNSEIITYAPRQDGLNFENTGIFYPGNISQQSEDSSLKENSNNLFGPNSPMSESNTSKQPQQNEDLCNTSNQIIENDYVNVWPNRENINKQGNQVTTVPGNLASPVNRCPVCSHEFPRMNMEDFQMHVLHCIDDSNDDQLQTLQNPIDTNNSRICPMCEAVFPSELPQEEYERHVQEHFGEDPIVDRFEVLHK